MDGQSWGSQVERGLDSPEDLRGEGVITGCRSQLYSAVGMAWYKNVLQADPIRTLQFEHNTVRTEDFPRYYTGSTTYIATYSAGWAWWHSPFDWEFALGLLRATAKQSHSGEYPRTPDKWPGAVAVGAAEERPLLETLNNCYWLAETRREQAICIRPHGDHTFESLLLDQPFTTSILICITNWANRSR